MTVKITYQLNKLDLIDLLAKVYKVESSHVILGIKTQQGPDGPHDEPFAVIQVETDVSGKRDTDNK